MKHNMIRLLVAAAVLGCVVLGAAADSAAPVEEAAPALIEGPVWQVAFRAEPDADADALRLCTPDGVPLAQIEPDADGDAALGPLRPGSYSVYDGKTELGRFLLADNAAILRADGRLWTDGELLHLAGQSPAALTVRCEIARPGCYTFTLTGSNGSLRSAVVSIPEGTAPDACGCYLRHLLFEGLHPGVWWLLEGGAPCAAQTLAAGETAQIGVEIP